MEKSGLTKLMNRPLHYYCKKNHGLLSMHPKVAVKDNQSLALVYTPGVAEACKAIQKNNSDALIYTNKANSILLLTDSSEFCEKDDKWRNDYAVPILETNCVYYKNIANIDAYPMILDLKLIKSDDDVFECMKRVAPAYSGFELIGMKTERMESLLKKFNDKSEFKTLIYTRLQRESIKSSLGSDMLESFVSACILRAALDLHITAPITNECIDFITSKLSGDEKSNVEGRNVYRLAAKIARLAAEYFISQKLGTLDMAAERVEEKLLQYYIEGPRSWIKEIPDNYYTLKHDNKENSLELHRRYAGVCETHSILAPKDLLELNNLFSKEQVQEMVDLCKKDEKNIYELTCKYNFCALITNSTAILGLGDIGDVAGLPVMEGKSVLFKMLGGVDVMPICIDEKNVDTFIDTVTKIAPMFSAINLEDIKAPDCFEIEQKLQERLNIPVFHDDQHGTAIVVVAGLVNALKLAKKEMKDIKIVISGSGAAGISVTEMLLHVGVKSVTVCDSKGAIYKGRKEGMNKQKEHLADLTNNDHKHGPLKDVINDADVFIGVSVPDVLKKDMVKSMAKDPIIFALANPVPEIMPDEAMDAGAFIVATGRSDFPNQINNSLAFPGVFRGALDILARKVNMEMKVAAAYAIANLVDKRHLTPDNIMPNALDLEVPRVVAKAVAEAGIKTKVHRNKVSGEFVEERIKDYAVEGVLRPMEQNLVN